MFSPYKRTMYAEEMEKIADNLKPYIFGVTLQDILEQYEMTQKDLAEQLPTDPAGVHRWCSGEKTPPLDKVALIVERIEADAEEEAGLWMAHAGDNMLRRTYYIASEAAKFLRSDRSESLTDEQLDEWYMQKRTVLKTLLQLGTHDDILKPYIKNPESAG